jgi:hypothetical protein
MSNPSTGSLSPDAPVASKGWLRVRRIIASGLVVAATVFLGIMLGKYFAHLVQDSRIETVLGIRVEWGLAAVGLTYIFASLQQVLKLASTFREYIAKPDKKVSLYPDCVALAFMVAYLTVLAVALQNEGKSEPAPTVPTALYRKEIVYLGRAPQTSSTPIEYFPFLFTELAIGDKDWSKGTTLTDQQQKDIERLISSLKACVGTSRGQEVELDVRGYADTNEFPSNSIELNRQTGNRRAAALHGHLKRLIGTGSRPAGLLLRELTEWTKEDPTAMTREQRYFQTLPLHKTGTDEDQALFNRRADILVLRLGICERLNAKQSNAMSETNDSQILHQVKE